MGSVLAIYVHTDKIRTYGNDHPTHILHHNACCHQRVNTLPSVHVSMAGEQRCGCMDGSKRCGCDESQPVQCNPKTPIYFRNSSEPFG